MTKIKPALTIESALDRVIGLIGRDDAAQVIEKSEAMLYAYGDPDKERHISLRDAMKLDAECGAMSGETPFFSMQQIVLEAGNFRSRTGITDALLNLHAEAGRLNELIRAAQALDSQGGRRVTQQEARRIHDVTDQLLTIIHGIRASVGAPS